MSVDRIVQHLFGMLSASDLRGTLEFWDYLSARFFARLDQPFTASVKKLEVRRGLLPTPRQCPLTWYGVSPQQLCLKRYYLVFAVQNNRHDRVLEFFETQSAELQTQPDWRDWFVLPFLKVCSCCGRQLCFFCCGRVLITICACVHDRPLKRILLLKPFLLASGSTRLPCLWATCCTLSFSICLRRR
jgi:hypothetical protein